MESLICTIKLMFHIQVENERNCGILFFVCFKFEFHLFHTLYAFLGETSQPIQLIDLNPANHNRQYGFGYSLRDTDVKLINTKHLAIDNHWPAIKTSPWRSLLNTWHTPSKTYSIPQEICTRFCCALLCCDYAIVHNEFTWSIYPYASGLLCWRWGNR